MKVNVTDTLCYWKYNFDINNISEFLRESYDAMEPEYKEIEGNEVWKMLTEESKIKDIKKGYLPKLILKGINFSKEIYESKYNSILASTWINVVKAKKAIQPIRDYEDNYIYHNHVDIAKRHGEHLPDYTFVFYLQMPDNLNNDDGKLFLRDYDGGEYSILPNVGECIILKGDVYHVPIDAPKSSKDRIVLAGNVTFLNNN